MHWIIQFFSSSIGKKIIMSLTGLFLIVFLLVHLVGNLQLLYSDGGEAFNTYAYFMTTNPLIKTVSYGLYFFILLHAVQGFMITYANKKAKAGSYGVNTNQNASWASKSMVWLGVLITAFLFMHMGDFWWKMKNDLVPMVTYEGQEYQDLYAKVDESFAQLWIVIAYVIGQIALAAHLWHGFASAFQSLGWNHKKYTPMISFVGRVFSIVVPLGFAIIPLYFYFIK